MSTSPETRHVQMLAYQIWEEEGRPSGRDMDHWMEAQRRLALEFRLGGPPEDQAGTSSAPAAQPVDVVSTPRDPATPQSVTPPAAMPQSRPGGTQASARGARPASTSRPHKR